jgi:ABC-type lipoprotein release transport system permease subunit
LAAAFVLAQAAALGWYLGGQRRSESIERPAGVAAWVRRVAPLTVGLGTTMAFRRSRGRSSSPVKPALVGVMVGVLGVVGALTIDHGLNDALTHPIRAGVAWDATVSPLPADLTATGITKERVDSVASVPGVASAAVVSRVVANVAGAGVPIYSVRQGVGSIELVSTAGRVPNADNEAAIGPATARQLHISTGDTIEVGSLKRHVLIVGEALFPTDVHAGFDEGLWLTPTMFESIEPPLPQGDPNRPGGAAIAVRFAPGANAGATIALLAKTEGDSIGGVDPAEVPPELINLRNVRPLPRLLAGFLALLAVVAVAHVLSTSVRRRRRDFAVLRALGMTRRSVRTILNMQGTAIGIAGLVVGIPLGVAAGRLTWRLITNRVPLSFIAPLAFVALLLVVPVTIGIINLLALLPARRAGRLQPAIELRAE